MRVRGTLVAATLCVFIGACGGNDGDGLPFAGPSVDPVEIAAAADLLVDRWGDDGAFFAIMASLDTGYTAAQIVDDAPTLTADGTIPREGPSGPSLDLLTPLDAGNASGTIAVHGIAAAPRRLFAAQGDRPEDQYVDFVDTSLGEIFSTAQRHIGSLDGATIESVTEVTLLLAASGYSAEQIVEAYITDSLDFRGLCAVVTSGQGDAVVIPAGAPQIDAETFCPEILGTTTTSTSTTTVAPGGSFTPGDGELDGIYEGTADLLFEDIPGVFELTESSVAAVVAGDDLSLDIIYTLRYVKRYTNDDPTCTASVRDTWSGRGFVVGGLLEIEIAPVTREIVELSGSACDVVESDGTARDSIMAEWAAEVPYAVFGSVNADGTLTGEFGDFLSFTANR